MKIKPPILIALILTSLNALSHDKSLADIPNLYKDKFSEFSKMVFVDGEHKIASAPNTINPAKTICNQEGYDEGVSIICEKGTPLRLDEQTPIGYNVHLPVGEVRGIFIQVYGGTVKQSRKTALFIPGALDAQEKFLLQNGVAVAQLNLIDLLELDVPQAMMPSALHERLHQSINHFFKALKNPSALHEDLGVLQNTPRFLYGFSFGGRCAIRHAEKFPGTFTGYLSFSGALDFAVGDKTGALISSGSSRGSSPEHAYLDPSQFISDLADPALIVHNLDDNRVNAAVSVSFFQQAISAKPELKNLLRLLLINEGSPIRNDLTLKGHHLPRDEKNQKILFTHVLRFLVDGVSNMPAASELTAHTHRHIGASTSTVANTDFHGLALSELHRRHFQLHTTRFSKISDETWNKVYLPIARAAYLISFMNDTWSKEQYVTYIRNHESLLTEDVLGRVLKRHAKRFAQYLVEKFTWNTDLSSIEKELLTNSEIPKLLKQKILALGQNSDDEYEKQFDTFLLFELLVTNEEWSRKLLEHINSQLDGADIAQGDESIANIRKDFENDLAVTERLAKDAWSQAIQEVLKRLKK